VCLEGPSLGSCTAVIGCRWVAVRLLGNGSICLPTSSFPPEVEFSAQERQEGLRHRGGRQPCKLLTEQSPRHLHKADLDSLLLPSLSPEGLGA
jgi:hypothetical protein